MFFPMILIFAFEIGPAFWKHKTENKDLPLHSKDLGSRPKIEIEKKNRK